MYDTARRVALVKQRVRENTRRRQRRGIYGLSAACMLLFAVLMQAAGTVVGPGQTAAWGVLRRDAAAGGRGRLCAGGRCLLCRGGGDHRAVLPAQNQRKPEKRRGRTSPTRHEQEEKSHMKKRILSILLLCCMVLTMMPATVFAADGEVAARASETGGLYEHHEAYGADPAGASDTMMPKTRSGAVRPAATQYTYTLHYDANGGSGAPPSQSEISSALSVWIPISEKIPTRDGYTFKGWADSPYGKPKYLREEGYYWNYLMVHPSLSETIYAVWEIHNHSWGEWTSNGNGTHTRTCTADSSHTETGNCSGGKATSTEKAVCETCHTAYGELLQPAKTVITTPPTLRLPAYVGNEYTDKALMGGEAKAEGTDTVVPGTFGFKYYEGGRVHPGENRMVILFTPDDTEAYTTAECIITVMGTKRTITRVPDDVIITDKPIGTAFEDLGLPLPLSASRLRPTPARVTVPCP